MWESHVLGEISKSLWKPVCGFHRDVISIAVFAVIEADSEGMLYPCRRVDRRSQDLLRGRLCFDRLCDRLTGESRFYFVTSSVRKSVWTLVRQLRGPHLSTCA